jgi:hypothetical protein
MNQQKRDTNRSKIDTRSAKSEKQKRVPDLKTNGDENGGKREKSNEFRFDEMKTRMGKMWKQKRIPNLEKWRRERRKMKTRNEFGIENKMTRIRKMRL